MGTPCVDMKRELPRGGHRHHLKVITIRRYGSIAKAVSKALLRVVCYTSVSAMEFPPCWFDPMMDRCLIHRWIKAQQEYAQLLEGADMILMLSSMLHSIGVGNMTPAGVKMVCVDINPAVVTKLSDRGSVEIGVVTDVGCSWMFATTG